MVEKTTSKHFRLDKLALFEDLGYQPHAAQLEVHRSTASRRVLACGVRFGKSLCATYEAVAAALEPREESLGWVVGPTYDLAHLIFRKVLRTLEQHVPHRIEDVVAREHRVVLRNLGGGISEVRARSADNADSLLGEGLDWLIVDEAARLKASIWEEHLSQRLIDRGGWALLVSTPRGKGWFYQLYKKGRGRDADFESWRFPSWTNPYLDAQVIERERGRLDETIFLTEYGAEFIGDELDRCDRCGDPDPLLPALVVLMRDEPMASCPECQAPVDASGKTLRTVRNGQPFMEVIRLYPGHIEVPMPGAPGDVAPSGEMELVEQE